MRITPVFKPADYTGGATDDLTALFDYLRPGEPDPEIDMGHAGVAIAAINPGVALLMAQLSKAIAMDTGWAKQTDLRELAFYTLNRHFRSDFSVAARKPYWAIVGISEEQMAAVADWQASPLLSDTQKLVVEYTLATVTANVTDALFDRVKTAFGETGAIEFTTLIGFWSCWAMVINAADPEF
ncbi:MAG: hypothetical protein ABW184_13230 [Sphingobium sp.]